MNLEKRLTICGLFDVGFLLRLGVFFEARAKKGISDFNLSEGSERNLVPISVEYSHASILPEKMVRAAVPVERAVPQAVYWIPLSFSALLPSSLLWSPFSAFKIRDIVVSTRYCYRCVRPCRTG